MQLATLVFWCVLAVVTKGAGWEDVLGYDVLGRLDSLRVQTEAIAMAGGPMSNVAFILNAWSERLLRSGQFIDLILQLQQQLPRGYQQDVQTLFEQRLQVQSPPGGFTIPEDSLFFVHNVLWELQRRLQLGDRHILLDFFYVINVVVNRCVDMATEESTRALLADSVRFSREVFLELL